MVGKIPKNPINQNQPFSTIAGWWYTYPSEKY